jgi:hypothetical protein
MMKIWEAPAMSQLEVEQTSGGFFPSIIEDMDMHPHS